MRPGDLRQHHQRHYQKHQSSDGHIDNHFEPLIAGLVRRFVLSKSLWRDALCNPSTAEMFFDLPVQPLAMVLLDFSELQ